MAERIPYRRGRVDPPPRPIPYNRKPLPLRPTERHLQLIGPPRPFDRPMATNLLIALSGLRTPLTLEILADENGVQVGICCPDSRAEEVARSMRGVVGEWEVTDGKPLSAASGQKALVANLGPLGRPDWAPLRDIEELEKVDTLSGFLEALEPSTEGDQTAISYLIEPVSILRRDEAFSDLWPPVESANPFDILEIIFGGSERMPRFEPKIQKELEERLFKPAYSVSGTVVLLGTDTARLQSRLRSLQSVFGSLLDCGWGGLTLEDVFWRGGTDASNLFRPNRQASLYFTVGELACLWHPPSELVRIASIPRLKRPTVLVTPDIERAPGLLLGTHSQQNRDISIRLPRGDFQSGHMAIIGRTGVGKSTFLGNFIGQLADLADSPGMIVIDPQGDLVVADLATGIIPLHREKDVVLLELGDTEFPASLPFITAVEEPSEALVQSTFALLRLLFRENWSPTRMEDAVYAIAATLCQTLGSTLLDANRLLTDPVFRRRIVAPIADPIVREFWQDYETLSEGGQREVARPVLYRLRSLYRSRAMRNILCQQKGLDFGKLMDRGAVILVSLAGEDIQAEADLLGELIIARIHLAAQARLDRPRDQRRTFYLAADESHRFKGVSLPTLLAESRKLGLSLILATQYLDNWGQALTESVLGTVGTMVAFRSGPADSRRLAATLKPFTPDHLEDLDRFEAIVKLQIEGATRPAIDIRALPPGNSGNSDLLARIRVHSRQTYCRPRREVEFELSGNDILHSKSRGRYDIEEE